MDYHEDMIVLDGQHFFFRACLEIPIENTDERFLWGLWVSVSKENFGRYLDTFDEAKPTGRYFSWLGNNLPGYPSVRGLNRWPTAAGRKPASGRAGEVRPPAFRGLPPRYLTDPRERAVRSHFASPEGCLRSFARKHGDFGSLFGQSGLAA
jgi:hypothetical protein